MIVTKTNKDWGVVYQYYGNNYRFALYTYDDEPDVTYLSNVRVDPKSRGLGIGDKILKDAEEIAIQHNSRVICLKVLINSWMHDWYSRHGFVNYADDEDSKYVWMNKVLER